MTKELFLGLLAEQKERVELKRDEFQQNGYAETQQESDLFEGALKRINKLRKDARAINPTWDDLAAALKWPIDDITQVYALHKKVIRMFPQWPKRTTL